MIIIQEAEKDTYISSRNLKTENLNKSNVGQASTLDLFKLNNENKNAYSEGAIKFLNPPAANEYIVLIDSNGNSVKFVFKSENFDSSNIGKTIDNNTDNIHVGLNITGSAMTVIELSDKFSQVVNNITSFVQTGTSGSQKLNITSHSNSLGEVILRQMTVGTSGDTIISTDIDTSDLTRINFRRIEKSAVLIKFDLEKIKKDFVYDSNDDGSRDGYNNSIFNTSNFEAKIVLKDVSTGHTKPFDYTLKLTPLNKSFNEGRGKDTIHFSDLDNANFININSTQTWKIPGHISYHNSDDVTLGSSNLYVKEFNVKKGNEDIEFDVTDWIKHVFSNNDGIDFGFIIDFKESDLQNSNSYFVKRLGSRHLLNKLLIPRLEIKLKDEKINLQTDINKKRYLNREEVFYLKNETDGIASSIPAKADSNLVFTINYNKNNTCKSTATIDIGGSVPDNASTFTLIDANNNSVTFQFDKNIDNTSNHGSTITNSSNILVGIGGWSSTTALTSTQIASRIISIINSVTEFVQVSSSESDPINGTVKNNKTLNITAYNDSQDSTKIVLVQDIAGSSGDTSITTGGTTNFTSISASFSRFPEIIITSSDPGGSDPNSGSLIKNSIFNFSGESLTGLRNVTVSSTHLSRYNSFLDDEISSTGYATFDLEWKWLDSSAPLGRLPNHSLKKETIKFYASESSDLNFNNKNHIRTSLITRDSNLYANNTIQNIEVMFFDIKKQYKTSKLPYELPCVNLGIVYYEVLNDRDRVLVKPDKDYTRLIWNGKNYEFDFYIPEMFKNQIIKFRFHTTNNIHRTSKLINYNENLIKVL